MALVLTIGISVMLVVLALVGYLRDPRRSLIALLGTLGGAALVDFWGARWGASLAGRLVEGNADRTTLWVSCLLFLWSALVVGYGGGALIAVARQRSLGQRLLGALLGLVNGLLIVGFLLRYGTRYLSGFSETLKTNLAANAINIGMPWLFLGAAIVVTILAIGRGLLSLMGRRATPLPMPMPSMQAKPPASSAPASKPAAPPSGPAPERKLSPQDIAEKADAALRGQQGR